MNARTVAVLVVLLVALGGGALLLQRQEASQRPAGTEALGKPLLKDLRAADVAAIRIVEPDQPKGEKAASLTLQRKEDGWTIAERGGFPADAAKVREFVLKMIELKIGQSEPITEQDRARLRLEEAGKGEASGTQVELAGADGKPLARLVVGRKYFSREVDNPERAPADGRFVRLPAETGTVYVVKDPLTQASAKSAGWIDRTGIRIEKVKTLQVRTPDGGGYRIERSGDNADWKLAGAKPGEKLEITRANAASYVLGKVELADVATGDAKEGDTGLEKPTLIEATTLDGKSYELKVGRLVGENYYVAFDAPQGDARDKVLAQHVLLVAKSKLEDTLKPRAEMLAKKEDTKK